MHIGVDPSDFFVLAKPMGLLCQSVLVFWGSGDRGVNAGHEYSFCGTKCNRMVPCRNTIVFFKIVQIWAPQQVGSDKECQTDILRSLPFTAIHCHSHLLGAYTDTLPNLFPKQSQTSWSLYHFLYGYLGQVIHASFVPQQSMGTSPSCIGGCEVWSCPSLYWVLYLHGRTTSVLWIPVIMENLMMADNTVVYYISEMERLW